MEYSDNCPARPGYFDPDQPVHHREPVHPQGMLAQDNPAACLWAQLQWERQRNDGGAKYLENLVETEWQRRNLCSGCLRDLDHPLMLEVDKLRQRAERAERVERQIAGINDAARLPDHAFRHAVLAILENEPPNSD